MSSLLLTTDFCWKTDCLLKLAAVTWMAMLPRTLPFALVIVWAALDAVPRRLDELALTDGAGWTRRLAHVWVPAAWPGLAAAFLVCYAAAVAEVGAAVIVSPPGREVLSVRTLTLAHYGVYANVASLALAMVALALPAAALLWLAARRALGPAPQPGAPR